MIYTAATAPSLSDSWTVYCLSSSLAPDAVRYVGITNDLRRRLSHHIHGAPRDRTRKSRWFEAVKRAGGHILAKVVSDGLGQEVAKEIEISLIAELRAAGSDLTNHTEGGDGAVGLVHTLVAREKMAAARRGSKLSPETRQKMSDVRRGRPTGRLGETLSCSAKAKIARRTREALSIPATRAKMVAAMLLRYQCPEVRQMTKKAAHLTVPTSRNKSGFKGVSYCPRTQKWVAQIKTEGRPKFIGRFTAPELAARAYDAAARSAWGGDCYLNFTD